LGRSLFDVVGLLRGDRFVADKCCLVELSEFSNALQRYFTHGDTYVEAIAVLMLS
jgi:hypothetical protein